MPPKEAVVEAIALIDSLKVEVDSTSPTVRLKIRASGSPLDVTLRSEISEVISRHGRHVLELSVHHANLDEIFGRITGEETGQ